MKKIAKQTTYLILSLGLLLGLAGPNEGLADPDDDSLYYFDTEIWGKRDLNEKEIKKLQEVEKILKQWKSGSAPVLGMSDEKKAGLVEELKELEESDAESKRVEEAFDENEEDVDQEDRTKRVQKRYQQLLDAEEFVPFFLARKDPYPKHVQKLAAYFLGYLENRKNFDERDKWGGKIALSVEGDYFHRTKYGDQSEPNTDMKTAHMMDPTGLFGEWGIEFPSKILLFSSTLQELTPSEIAAEVVHEIFHLKWFFSVFERAREAGLKLTKNSKAFKMIKDWMLNDKVDFLEEAQASMLEGFFYYAYLDPDPKSGILKDKGLRQKRLLGAGVFDLMTTENRVDVLVTFGRWRGIVGNLPLEEVYKNAEPKTRERIRNYHSSLRPKFLK